MLRTARDPFTVWFRQRVKDLFNGLDLTQIELESLSQLVFDGPSVARGEARSRAREAMERLRMINP